MSNSPKSDAVAKAAAELVLRELNDVEASDIFGGGWVKIGPLQPVPSLPPPPPPPKKVF